MYEETKIRVEKADYLLGTYENSIEGKSDAVFIYAKTISEKQNPQKAFELADAKWFPVKDLPENVSPATRARIEEFLAGGRGLSGNWIS